VTGQERGQEAAAHVFDERLAARMDVMYAAADVVRRRALVRAALAPAPGQHLLDLGCGPGFAVAELAGEVGADGTVTGVDGSEQMLVAARRRCADQPNVRFARADAGSIPLPAAAVDGAVCVQVLEYVPDPDAVLRELARVVRPGGRVVVWDVDWSSVSWHTARPERMARVLRAFDEHLTHPALPRTLVASLRSAGFSDVRVEGHCFTATSLDPDSYVGAVVWPIIGPFVVGREGITARQAREWADEQRALDADGRFFFSCVQHRVVGTRLPD
jgi:arsenite methyltransferase